MGSSATLARPDTVRLYSYDAARNKATIIEIPPADLASDMVAVRIQGLEGQYWVKSSSIRRGGPSVNLRFCAQETDAIRNIQYALREVVALTFDQWVEDFGKDAYPSREIETWVRVSWTFTRIVGDPTIPLPAKRDVLRVLLACTTNPRDKALNMVNLQAIPLSLAEKVVEAFYVGSPD